ncbi:Rrf2 family transcriptional regulator [Pseudomonas petrae]|nr:Rrf2 family transcriptional regulator [Pseudomonas petrae]MCF7535091.1 Rrf2 family transcriptional regulator [Pseudomonas petrae]MCF7558376.1 Rrf2 family transcriptional regulator [Pseudomonas petrae]
MVDLRFSSALQSLLSIAYAHHEGLKVISSAQLASGLNANPSFVRKLMAPLAEAGLVTGVHGKLGGLRLTRPTADITLADIYLAVSPDKKMFAARNDIEHCCMVTSNIDRLLADVSERAHVALLGSLQSRTLQQCLDDYVLEGASLVQP